MVTEHASWEILTGVGIWVRRAVFQKIYFRTLLAHRARSAEARSTFAPGSNDEPETRSELLLLGICEGGGGGGGGGGGEWRLTLYMQPIHIKWRVFSCL